MSNPYRVLIWVFAFLAAVSGIAFMLAEPLATAFQVNPIFNGVIVGVLCVGILVNIRQVLILKPDVDWVAQYDRSRGRSEATRDPRLLSPLATMLAGRNQRGFLISAMTMRSVLDGVRVRLDESRDISHYLAGLLIFLGLLGTFWGLLATVSGVTEVIAGISQQSGEDVGASFNRLIKHLQTPLHGMGTSFSSSLFGLAGSLVLGFLDLQAGHVQNRFFNELEEWLAELAHLPSGVFSGEGEGGGGERSVSGYIEALLEQTSDSLDKLQRTMSRNEKERIADLAKQMELNEKIAELTDQMRTEQKAMLRLAQVPVNLEPILAQLVEQMAGSKEVNIEVREYLRMQDANLNRTLKSVSEVQQKAIAELTREVRLLSHVILQTHPNKKV